MTAHRSTVFVLLLLPACAPAQANREISGIVVNARSGEPVAGAELVLRQSRDGKVVAQQSSDAQGHFDFPNLVDGKFALIVTGKGYVPSAYQEHEPGVSTAIVTGESMATTGLRFELSPQARITGEVQEDSGDPVPRARVSLYRRNLDGTGTMARVRMTSADPMGRFDFTGLKEGTYFACAFGSPWYATQFRAGMGQDNVSPRRRQTLDVAYPPTCYPEVTDPSQAEAIAVNAGDQLPLTIRMHPAPAMHISMEIPRLDEKHPFMVPQFSTRIFGIEEQIPSTSGMTGGGESDEGHSTSRLDIQGVPAGQYEVSVTGQNGEPSRQMSVDVSPDRLAMDLTTANPLAQLTGQIETSGGENPRQGSYVWLHPHIGSDNRNAPVKADGTFTFPSLRAGEYDVNVGTPQGARMTIASVAAKGGALSGHTVKVGNQPVQLAIVVGQAKATVNGIAMRHGSPAAGVFILLVPAGPHPVSEQLQTNQSDFDGTFDFYRVPAGAYTVVAIEEGWKLDWARPQVIAPYRPGGVNVTIRADATTVNLPNGVEVQPANLSH